MEEKERGKEKEKVEREREQNMRETAKTCQKTWQISYIQSKT